MLFNVQWYNTVMPYDIMLIRDRQVSTVKLSIFTQQFMCCNKQASVSLQQEQCIYPLVYYIEQRNLAVIQLSFIVSYRRFGDECSSSMRSHFTEYSAICTIFWKLLSIAYVLCLPFTVENVFSLAYISALSISRFVCIVQCLYSKRVAGGFALVAINIYQRHKNSPPLKLLPFFFFFDYSSRRLLGRRVSEWQST